MRSKLVTTFAVLGAVTVLVLAANTVALAATGKGFLLGKTNTANTVTTLSRTTPGTALQVKTKSNANAPFAVNGTGKVAHLNADKLDGLDSSELTTRPLYLTKQVLTSTTSFEMSAPVANGTYLFSYSAYLQGTAALGNVHCWVRQFNGFPKYIGESDHVGVTSIAVGLSGSGLFARGTGGSINLHCDADTAFKTNDNQPIQFIVTKVNGTGPN